MIRNKRLVALTEKEKKMVKEKENLEDKLYLIDKKIFQLEQLYEDKKLIEERIQQINDLISSNPARLRW